MTSHNHLTAPVGAHHSFSIELECLVAYVPTEGRDPDEFTTPGLPALLHIDFSTEDEYTAVLSRILDTFNNHGIPAVGQPSKPSQSIASLPKPPGLPLPSENIDPSKWVLSVTPSADEYFLAGYFWQTLKIRSPVMWSREESFEQVHRAINLLISNYRLRVNSTCNFSVHVGSGNELFTETTIKRIRAFLPTANSMLSRLEKPWQRITLNNSSADGIPAEQASNGREGERLEEFGSAPTVDLPNTSREEKDHDSKEKLTEFPRWEDEAQPSEKSDKSEIRLPSYHDVLDAGHRALDEDLEIDVPPDPNTLHRNVGWVLWDKTQDRRLVKWLYEYCHETYGHTKLHKLPANDQVYHMLRTQCAIMFGHTNLFALDRDEEYKVLVTASSYLSAMRSSWEWDDETERWRLAWRRFGNILRHPAAHREIKIDAPYVVQKFENLAKLTELHSEDSELGVEYINPEEYEEAMSTNKGVEDLLDGLKEYAEPVDPNYMDYLQDPKTEGSFVTTESTHSFSNFSHFSGASNEDPDDQFPPAGFNFPAWRNLMQDIRRFGRVVGLRSEHESDSSFTTSSSPVYHIPPSNPLHSLDQAQKYEDILNYIRNIETPSVRPETPPINSPLNNPDEFETLQETSNRKHAHITEEQGDRVEHPETSTNPRPGPYVTSEHRRAELASYTKSITPVELVQFNYKLIPKTPSPPRDPEYPTYCEINFYEAPRALNAAWLTTRTYVGIVRWAQDASLDEHLRVLYQIRAQERREAGNSEENEEVDSGEDLYDVCHLLKDLRLDTEAEWACKQEPQGAPKTK